MSEGPQVRHVTERLRRLLEGQAIAHCKTTRESLREFSETVVGSHVRRVFCKGKHIFIEFASGRFLQNHLLMRGRWRSIKGRLLFLPSEMWLALEVDNATVCNINGQVLRVLDSDGLQRQLDLLGPDVMSSECSTERIIEAIRQHDISVGEVLLDQSVLSGIGNVAKSESLFLAGVHPEVVASALDSHRLARLAESIRHVMWESYNAGGRWTHRVYRRAGMQCFRCGSRITMIRQGKQSRSTYLCPTCQRCQPDVPSAGSGRWP